MTRPVDESLTNLLRPPAAPDELELTRAENEFAIDAVEAALVARASSAKRSAPPSAVRPTRWVRWSGLAAAAMAAGVTAWVFHASSPAGDGAHVAKTSFATKSTPSGSSLLVEGDPIEAGDRLRTPIDGQVTIRLSDGATRRASASSHDSVFTSVSLGEKSELLVRSLGAERRFTLEQGTLSASVVKLKPEEHFSIETPGVVVEVKGTRFAVEARVASDTCRQGSTLVTVEEGVVSVREGQAEEALVHAGERHLFGCEAPARAPEPGPAAVHSTGPRPPSPPRSSLERMNAQYAKAMALKQQGQGKAAARTLRELRETFPLGPLDEAAAVEELRLLEQVDPAAARAAAAAYLIEYPAGYARDVAEGLLTP